MKKSLYVLGINEAIGASAALLKDGKIIAAATEERFSRIKNQWGFPKKAISFCCQFAKIKSSQLDLVVLSYIDPYPHFVEDRAKEKPDSTPPFLRNIRDIAPGIEHRIPLTNHLFDAGRSIYYKYYQPKNQERQIADIAKSLHIRKSKIQRTDHHLAHAYSAYYSNPRRTEKPTLVMTNDGAGDQFSAAIYKVTAGKFKLISKTPHAHSIGLFYSAVTGFLGLKAHEDEYKVMGLAPYYQYSAKIREIENIFKKLIWTDGLEFRSLVLSRHFGHYLKDNLKGHRFDAIAAAAQTHFETLMLKWVKNAVKKTKLRNVAFAGGSFLNVKANQKITQLPSIKQGYFMPSPGDDTNAIGAAYWGYKKLSVKFPSPVRSLYLGPQFTYKSINSALKKYSDYKIIRPRSIAKMVAKLLEKGEIVAHFSGRMEFGARALGNRSILANPSSKESVEQINKMIKKRDFWMPFAPTILSNSTKKYIINPKKLDSPYMVLAFETTDKGKQHLAAATHPYDKTTRPQILYQAVNPNYSRAIEEFKKLTGIGAVLNTSFNIHGEPIVCSPEDALSTFTRSGLKYLLIEGLLISKND